MIGVRKFVQVGLTLDPVHVGTGGTRIGGVDLAIVRDPATRLPKIPGSSLAGVYRTYVAMAETEEAGSALKDRLPYYPHCAGLGQPRGNSYSGHCGRPDCPVCTIFGFARGQSGGFAGLLSFSDAHILLFPVPTYMGPYWVTSPMALQGLGIELSGISENAVYLDEKEKDREYLNLGWLLLPVKIYSNIKEFRNERGLERVNVPRDILERIALLPDHLFAHVVNSNLEVRTSVSINPETGAAEEGALFSYEALPRKTLLVWETIAKNPQHFKINGEPIKLDGNGALSGPDGVQKIAQKAHPYLEHLGMGGMGTRGMGRIKVLYSGPLEGT